MKSRCCLECKHFYDDDFCPCYESAEGAEERTPSADTCGNFEDMKEKGRTR